MKDVFCIGEALIDFVAENQGNDLSKANLFTKKAGGAPANVAAAVSKLGGKSHFAGALGKDAFGKFLINTLKKYSVSTRYIQQVDTFTTLAFVSLAENGERDFVFNRGADALLKCDKKLTDQLKNNMIHFGAATAFLGDELEKTYSTYLSEAFKQNSFISFDPNFRSDLWKGKEKIFIKKCIPFIEKADFAKFGLEEAQLISGESDVKKAANKLHEIGANLITITLGESGTLLSVNKTQVMIESISVNSLDTTGAGDAFVGCFLKQVSLLDEPKEVHKNISVLKEMTRKSNIAGALTTTNYGAIASLPSWAQIMDYA